MIQPTRTEEAVRTMNAELLRALDKDAPIKERRMAERKSERDGIKIMLNARRELSDIDNVCGRNINDI